MCIEDIKKISNDFLTAEDVASVLGVDPQNLRTQIDSDASKIGFPFTKIGRRVFIPKAGFLNWYGV